MRAYWVPGVNNLGKFGRWAFAEFTAVYEIEAEFNKLLAGTLQGANTQSITYRGLIIADPWIGHILTGAENIGNGIFQSCSIRGMIGLIRKETTGGRSAPLWGWRAAKP